MLLALASPPASAHDPDSPEGRAAESELLRQYEPTWRSGERIIGGPLTCTNGKVDKYPCKNVDLPSFLPQSALGGGSSSMWYWTDTRDRNEYILYCRSNGVSFVNLRPAAIISVRGNAAHHPDPPPTAHCAWLSWQLDS
jgi:hypothetical protein